MAVDTVRQQVVFRYGEEHMDVFEMADASAKRHEILRLNSYLKDVIVGTYVRVDYKGLRGEPLICWVLLPPAYQPGRPLPAVVDVYPGTVNGEQPSMLAFGEAETHPLAPSAMFQILAGHGYAVIIPSLPIEDSDTPGDPLRSLKEAVLVAVDAAVASGYVDGDRLAIQGTSFGGYATVGVISQTDRFKGGNCIRRRLQLIYRLSRAAYWRAFGSAL